MLSAVGLVGFDFYVLALQLLRFGVEFAGEDFKGGVLQGVLQEGIDLADLPQKVRLVVQELFRVCDFREVGDREALAGVFHVAAEDAQYH